MPSLPAPQNRPHQYRAGVDIGGTFTDLIVVDDVNGSFSIGKTLTTPSDPSLAIETGLNETLAKAGITHADLGQIIHGTTLVTNAIIERKGAPTALLATQGFKDALEIGREHRYDLYDLQLEMPQPLVPRYLRFDVPQRTLSDGSTLHALDEVYLEKLIRELDAAGITAIAIAFINSYTNPAAERQARAVVQRAAPNMRVSISADVVPEIREYERTSTTVANVYVQARVEHYLRELEARLARAGFTGSLLLMLSSGGLGTVDTAVRYPVRLLESGPAGGALAAARFGLSSGTQGHAADLLSFDMGGTTAKFAIIDQGKPLLAHDFEVDRRYRFKKGSGLPIKAPVIEMIEIGAGGGSIARLNALGLLKIGPESAGAEPGPACYGRGGTEPTVTDADLVLGFLDPQFFLGGVMALDVAAARRAIETRIAIPLGLSIEQAAWGIHQIVNEQMANAARVHSIERGKDPRTLPIFAFGGAGPVHAYRVAASLGSPQVIVPFGAGVMSAIGFLSAPLAFDFTRSFPTQLAALTANGWAKINALLGEMQAEGTQLLCDSGVAIADIQHQHIAEMRYVGQGHEIRIRLPNHALSAADLPAIQAEFEREYVRFFGRLGPPVPLEAVTWRVISSSPEPNLRLSLQTTSAQSAQTDDATPRNAISAIKTQRMAYAPEAEGEGGTKTGTMQLTPVYDRYRLAPGMMFDGPAIVEEREATLIIGRRGRCHVDAQSNLIVDLQTIA